MIKRQHFPIQGMTCRNCVAHVEKALKKLPGISQIAVNLDNQEAMVEYETPKITHESMALALKDAGYIMGNARD